MGRYHRMKEAVKSMVEPDRYQDVLNHGCVSGTVGGLIYYSDTVAFYNEHEEAITDLAQRMAEDMGMGYLEFCASLNGAKNVSNDTERKNLLAWFACEEVVRELADELEQHDPHGLESCSCGAPLDDGEGYNGYCGECEDARIEEAELGLNLNRENGV